jgi:hypothetical protein
MSCVTRLLVVVVLLSRACSGLAAEPVVKPFEAQLLDLAPKLLEKFQAQGYQNVGVLKFSIKYGDRPISEPAGVLNTRLSAKVELALIVANNLKQPLGIVHNASATAATIRGANHATAEGRPRLFEKTYPLAWGSQRVTPDAFVTGIAAVSADLRTMTVYLQAFDKTSLQLATLAEFTAPVELEQLLDAGESFSVRGVFDRGNVEYTSAQLHEQATAEAVQTALVTKQETAQATKPTTAKLHPLAAENQDSPVTFEVRYNNQPQKLEFRNGAAFLPEPTEHQAVSLVVRRRGHAGPGTKRPRFGIVVKVNGESTLERETAADPQCKTWVLEEELAEFGLYGYYLKGDQLQKFQVLSSAASQSRELDYGADVGLISISVFPEAETLAKTKADQTLPVLGLDILKRNQFPHEPKNSLAALQAELESSFNRDRGIVVPGKTVKQRLATVPFRPASIPLMSGSIRYYTPQDLPQ